MRAPPASPLFPYTTLFRSRRVHRYDLPGNEPVEQLAAVRMLFDWLITGQIDRKSHTSELQSPDQLVCRLLLEKKKPHAQAPRRRRNGTEGGAPIPGRGHAS